MVVSSSLKSKLQNFNQSLKTLTSKWYYLKSEIDAKIANESTNGLSKVINNLTTSTHSAEKALSAYQGYVLEQNKLDKAQGATNTNKNIITDTSGNITTETKSSRTFTLTYTDGTTQTVTFNTKN